MSDCIFCKIAGGDIPSATLYEDDDFRVILDLGPATKGHALILPKHHYANLYEIPEEMAAKAMVLAKKMAFPASGFSHNCQNFPFSHSKTYIPNRLHFTGICKKAYRQMFCLQ